MAETSGTVDLLSLIGSAIEQLQECILLFENEDSEGGVRRLTVVIREISSYLDHSDEDPIVRLSGIDTSHLAESLQHVQSDLASVVQQIDHPAAAG